MALQEATVGPITRVQIARYAGAVGDFNPIHVDEEFAKGAGLPSVIAHGPLTLALALDAIARQVGPKALRRLDARLRSVVVPGDTLTVVPTDEGIEVRNGSGAVVATALLNVEEAT